MGDTPTMVCQKSENKADSTRQLTLVFVGKWKKNINVEP